MEQVRHIIRRLAGDAPAAVSAPENHANKGMEELAEA
jgi:hypothetical protein